MEENDIGRALEYAVSITIAEHARRQGITVSYSVRAASDNKRDAVNFALLVSSRQEDFLLCGAVFCGWLDKRGYLKHAITLEIDRLPDSAGVGGDVTDFTLRIAYLRGKTRFYRFSLKNTHNALKHPRLTRFPKDCGVTSPGIVAKYKKEHDKIWLDFFAKIKSLCPNATLVKHVKAVSPSFVEDNLYVPFNKLIMAFLNGNVNNPINARILFTFLVTSSTDYIGIKNEKHQVLIKHFNGISLPSGLKVSRKPNNKTTFFVEFDNGWTLSFRLHTASSHLYTKTGKKHRSVKYDVQSVDLDKAIRVEVLSKQLAPS